MYIIAEIAQAHDGSLGIAHSYIDALAETGVDAVKFQTHIAEAESSPFEPFRINFSFEDPTRFDYWKRMEFTPGQWAGLKRHAEEKGLEFISTPFSNAAVDLLERLGVKRYKVGSGDTSNFLLLEKIARTGKPMIISSGMSTWDELDRTVDFLRRRNTDFSILQTTTAYPTQPENYGLNVIPELKARYGVPVGYSDHSARMETGIAAVTLGAEILEFHVVFDRRMFGPDSKASLTIDETKQLVEAVRNLEKTFTHPVDKSRLMVPEEVKRMFEKSLAVNKNLPAGHILQFKDLEAKKPSGYGIPANRFTDVVGKKLKTSKQKWDFLREEDLE